MKPHRLGSVVVLLAFCRARPRLLGSYKLIRIMVTFVLCRRAPRRARIIGEPLSRRSARASWPRIVAAGRIASSTQVARAEADGYTILMGGSRRKSSQVSPATRASMVSATSSYRLYRRAADRPRGAAVEPACVRSVTSSPRRRPTNSPATASSGVGTLGHLVGTVAKQRSYARTIVDVSRPAGGFSVLVGE